MFQVRGHMVWGCGKIFIQDGRGFPTFSDLRLGRAMVFIFGMMFRVVQGLLSVYFPHSTRLQVTNRVWWLTC